MKDSGKSAGYADKMRKFRLKRLTISRLKFVHRKPKPKSMPEPEPNPKPSDELMSTTTSAESSDCTGAGGGLVFGHVSMMGRRREMEDTVTVGPPALVEENYSFFAVYDGHGGAKVAERCRDNMHEYVAMHVKKEKEKEKEDGCIFDWGKVMAESFGSMEAEIEEDCSGNEAAQREKRMMGSTATVVLVGKEDLVVANCGDSRAVLSRAGGVVLPLSTDHKPDREDEKERIEGAGGMIINWNGWRVEGVLSTSRSLGDVYLKPYVCSEPEVSIVKRTGSDEFLIIATDGLFDVVSNEVACDVVRRCLSGKIRRREAGESRVSQAAAVLAELALAKGSKDNISVIVVQMK